LRTGHRIGNAPLTAGLTVGYLLPAGNAGVVGVDVVQVTSRAIRSRSTERHTVDAVINSAGQTGVVLVEEGISTAVAGTVGAVDGSTGGTVAYVAAQTLVGSGVIVVGCVTNIASDGSVAFTARTVRDGRLACYTDTCVN
jgi:hypothetical protein